ncbi:MAG: UPF0149 family protein [Spirochaetota bacterium]
MHKIQFLPNKIIENIQKYLNPSLNPDVFNMTQLDGFLFCLSISSPFIPQSKIIPSIFGSSQPVLNSFEDVSNFNHYLIEAQNVYTKALNKNTLVFPFEVSENNLTDELVYSIQDWCYGFTRGIILSYEDWLPPDKEILKTLNLEEDVLYFCIFLVYMIAYILYPDKIPVHEKLLSMVVVEKFKNELTKNILALPEAVGILVEYGKYRNSAILSKVNQPAKSEQSIKAGRNEPCPCGSGKKYKKCCGKNI